MVKGRSGFKELFNNNINSGSAWTNEAINQNHYRNTSNYHFDIINQVSRPKCRKKQRYGRKETVSGYDSKFGSHASQISQNVRKYQKTRKLSPHAFHKVKQTELTPAYKDD